jgi:3'-5' exoribonuclease
MAVYMETLTQVTFLMTDNGRLLWHISQGLLIVNEYDRNCHNLSSQRLSFLQHLILSHHGKLEWGSPLEPCTLEAVLLHESDMLDVQIHKIDTAIEEAHTNDGWTDKISGMNRQFYITNKK